MSILYSSALTDLFLPSYHLHHLLLCVYKRASFWLACESWLLCWRKSWHIFQGLQFLLLILSSHICIFPRHIPRSLFFVVWLSYPDSSIGCGDLELCPEKELLWPLSSCPACQDLQVFPVNVLIPGLEGKRAGRKDGKQEVGLWHHFALTHILPFCS